MRQTKVPKVLWMVAAVACFALVLMPLIGVHHPNLDKEEVPRMTGKERLDRQVRTTLGEKAEIFLSMRGLEEDLELYRLALSRSTVCMDCVASRGYPPDVTSVSYPVGFMFGKDEEYMVEVGTYYTSGFFDDHTEAYADWAFYLRDPNGSPTWLRIDLDSRIVQILRGEETPRWEGYHPVDRSIIADYEAKVRAALFEAEPSWRRAILGPTG